MLYRALGIGEIRPDYIFAYIGREPLPQDCAAALETELAELGEDINGDGRVAVELRQYATQRSGDAETALYYNYAADTLLLADITAGDSYYFLVEDPQGVQKAYQIFARADGTPPEDQDYDVADKVLSWSDCPTLGSLAVDQERLSQLYIGRRCFFDDKRADVLPAYDAFWQLLTKGAER